MDPVTVVVTALAAGAAAGAKDTASSAVRDAYNGLRELVRRRFAGRGAATVALEQHAADPQVWEAPLRQEMAATGAADDAGVLQAAQQLLALVDAVGAQAGKYQVDASQAQGVQVGDRNVQTNTFGAPPAG
jgi:hypothetical protein